MGSHHATRDQVTVKKADFDHFIPGGVKELPLTGASFTFDKKRKLETIDLLARFDPRKDELVTSWKMSGAPLVGTGAVNHIATMQMTYTPPEEYDLTMALEHKDGDRGILVGSAVSAHQNQQLGLCLATY